MEHVVRNVFRLADRYAEDISACERQFRRIILKPRPGQFDRQTLARILFRVMQLKQLLFAEIHHRMNHVAIQCGPDYDTFNEKAKQLEASQFAVIGQLLEMAPDFVRGFAWAYLESLSES